MEIFLFVPNHNRFFYSHLKTGTKRGFSVSALLPPAAPTFTVLAAVSTQNLIKMKTNKRIPK
jgi:hypothetical protein